MIDKKIVKNLSDISLTLFRKNFFGVYHGSISKKINHEYFVINTKDAIFDELSNETLCQLSINTEDYSWKLASIEAHIHKNIYKQIHEAKYIACGMPPYTTAYSLDHDQILFEDYFGKTIFKELFVHNPDRFDNWYERNFFEIPTLLKFAQNNLIVIKGIGVYVYDRDINELVKKVAILENSCRLLALKSQFLD